MDVFISYSRKDRATKDASGKDIISLIQEAFRVAGISYWLDEEGIHSGETFASKISRNISESKVFLFVSSVNSNASRWTCGEIATASSYEKRIIPFKIDAAPYDPSVTIYLAALDTIDYTVSRDRALKRLVKSVQTYLEEIEAEARRVEEQKKWLEEQERLLAEQERIRQENEREIIRLSVIRGELEEKMRALDVRLDDLINEKNHLIGQLSTFKLQIAELQDERNLPAWPHDVAIIVPAIKIENDEKGEVEAQEPTLPLKTKKKVIPFWFYGVCMGVMVGGLIMGYSFMQKNHSLEKHIVSLTPQDSSYVEELHDSALFVPLIIDDDYSVQTVEVQKSEESGIKQDAVSWDDQQVNKNAEGEEEVVIQDETDAIIIDEDVFGDTVYLPVNSGTHFYQFVLPKGYRFNDLKILEYPDWCRVTIDKAKKGIFLEWDECPWEESVEKGITKTEWRDVSKQATIVQLSRTIGTIVLSLRSQEVVLWLDQQNRVISVPFDNSSSLKEPEKHIGVLDSLPITRPTVTDTPKLKQSSIPNTNIKAIDNSSQIVKPDVVQKKTEATEDNTISTPEIITFTTKKGNTFKAYKKGEFYITEVLKWNLWDEVMKTKPEKVLMDASIYYKDIEGDWSAEYRKFASRLGRSLKNAKAEFSIPQVSDQYDPEKGLRLVTIIKE